MRNQNSCQGFFNAFSTHIPKQMLNQGAG